MAQDNIANGLDVFGFNQEALERYQKQLALNQKQRADAVKQMNDAEERYLNGKRKTIMGIESLGNMARDIQKDYLKNKRNRGRPQQGQQPSNRPFNPRFPNFNQGAQTDPEQQTQTGLLRQIKDNTTITQVSIA